MPSLYIYLNIIEKWSKIRDLYEEVANDFH